MAAPGLVRSFWRGADAMVVRGWGSLTTRFAVWTNAGTAGSVRQALVDAGAVHCRAEAWEVLRVLEGTPRFGVDIRDRDLAQETGQTRALHFSKGCYLGQEIVERIRSRGAVHRTFGGFVLEGAMPAAGEMQLFTEDAAGRKAVGELTSVLALPDGAGLLALGYVRREVLERGGAMVYSGGAARAVELPFAVAASLVSGPLGMPNASDSHEGFYGRGK